MTDDVPALKNTDRFDDAVNSGLKVPKTGDKEVVLYQKAGMGIGLRQTTLGYKSCPIH